MPLLSFERVSVSFGRQPLLEHASFQIDAGERVCLIGRNGAGKSTLLKIASGEVTPDAGEIWRTPALSISSLSQELPFDDESTVFDVVASGLAEDGRLLAEFHRISHATSLDASLLARMDDLQHEIEARGAWSLSQRVDQILARLDLDADARLGKLSGGWRRRVALAQALVCKPDLLLLDEPTNHLDIEVIEWLEAELLEFRGAVLFVTHDRALLTRLATRIVELDRGVLTSWTGDYPQFLAKKAAALEEEERHRALFDKKLAQEEVWIRQGIKARRTRNEGRVRALVALREERARRRELEGKSRLALDEGQASGKLVIDARHVSFAFADFPIVRDFSLRIMRGDRIGLVGPNGAGKTTLLRLLLGQLTPAKGSVRLGTKLEVAYYDQLRAVLELEKTVMENIAEGREYVEVQGQRRHVISYLQDFLFSPDRARTPAKVLSGGERNRLVLARLFAQPANLLVLDEPTNDLDIETLELLEEILVDYAGTILLVSHDRAFLDNVVTSTLVFEGQGRVQEYVGGYADWLRLRQAGSSAKPAPRGAPGKSAESTPARRPKAAKLSYKDERELGQAPARIESLETEQAELTQRVSQPAFYKGGPAEQARVHARLAALATELAAAYARWEALEALREAQG